MDSQDIPTESLDAAPSVEGWSLIVMLPHDGQEPPASVSEEMALAAWCAATAIWHPSILARAQALPRFESIESPSSPGPHEVRVIVEGTRDRLPSGYQVQAEDIGTALIDSGTDRNDLIRRIRERIAADGPDETATAADFLALGAARWMLRDLTTAMGHSEEVDRESLWRELAAGALAWQSGDFPGATNRLRAGFELLTQARERFYPVEAYLLDICLLDPALPGGALAGPMADPVPITILAPAVAIEAQAAADPDRIAALRQAITDGWADVIGGTYLESDDALLPMESILWQYARGGDVYHAHLDDRGVETFARRRFGLFPQLPQIAKRFGIRYALHMSFDAGRFPLRPETKRLWEAPDGSSLEAMVRPPMAGDRPSHGWRLAWRLAATMRDDHTAAMPIVRWPSPVAPWLLDLRRVGSYSPVLGRWTTLGDFFHLTDRPYENFRPEPDAYVSPYLAQAVARDDEAPISWLARHRRLRARLDAARMAEAMAHAIASTAGDDSRSFGTGPDLLSIEESIECRRPAEAGRDLDEAEKIRARALSDRIVGRREGSTTRRGYLVLNPIGIARRASVILPDASPDLRPEGPLRSAQLVEEGVCAVVDLPPFGFAWVPAETDLSLPIAESAGLSARDRELRNDSMSIEIDAATGGLRGIRRPDEPSARLGQQIAIVGLHELDGKAIATQMRCDRREIDFAGPALAQATSTGRIVDPREEKTLATFEQRYRLWTGRPILEIRIALTDLDPDWSERLRRSDPWTSYLACRWAWPDASSMIRRLLLGSAEMTEQERPETPEAIDITTRTQRTAILFGGLAHHRKPASRMLDTLLIAGAEASRTFELGVALDLEHPFQATQDFVTPPMVVAVDGPPAQGVVGWLARVDHPAIAITRVEFTENAGDRGWGLIFHLLETAGQSARSRLRLFRNPTWARQVDFLGETIVDLTADEDAVRIDLTPHELARVEVTLG